MSQFDLLKQIRLLRRQGRSIRAIAAELALHPSRVQRALKAMPSNQFSRAGEKGFVGRSRELELLSKPVQDCARGLGCTLMVAGEPGIGKTRVAQELSFRAEALGFQGYWGRCSEAEGAPPYWPWLQLFRSYLDSDDLARGPEGLCQRAAEVVDLLAAGRGRSPDLGPNSYEEPAQERFRSFDAVASFLKQAARINPLLLVLDDLHWADRSSLDLLAFLAQELSTSPVVMLGTYRDEEVGRRHPLSETLGSLVRNQNLLRVHLSGLDLEEARELVTFSSGGSLAPEASLDIHRRTRGNPLFIVEIVRMLNQSELVEGSSYLTGVPEGVRDVIGRRLNRVSPQCDEVLTTAAAIGWEFDFRRLSGVMNNLDQQVLLSLLQEGLSYRIIEETDGQLLTYHFSHALVQETLLRELSGVQKAEIHGRIAVRLESLYGTEARQHAAELAHHYSMAEAITGPEKVAGYSRMAAEQALDSYAWNEASEHLRRGLRAKNVDLDSGAPARDEEEAALLFALGRAQLASAPRNATALGLAYLERSFNYYADAGQIADAVKVAAYPLPRGLGGLGAVENRFERAFSLLPPDSVEVGSILPNYALELSRFENRYDDAVLALERSLAIARREQDGLLEIRALSAWSHIDYFHLHLAEGLERSLSVAHLSALKSDLYAQLNAHLHALQALIHLGDSGRAREHSEIAMGLLRSYKAPRYLGSVQRCVVNLYRFLGEWQCARDLLVQYWSREPEEHVPMLKEAVSLELELGGFEKARAYLAQMRSTMELTPRLPCAEYADTALMHFYASWITGSEEFLDAALQASKVVIESDLTQPFWTEIVQTGLALRAVQSGNAEAAQYYYRVFQDLEGMMRGSFICSHRLMGLLSQTIGELERAAGHFQDALEYCRSQGFGPDLAWSCYEFAGLLLQRQEADDVSRADSLLEESLGLAKELEMVPLLERVNDRREQLGARRQPAEEYPANITRRQWEVLSLLSQGMTNREIAQELVLSERTVQRHIADVYDKIGARNRAEATAIALNLLGPTK